jgi:Ca2+-binding RTX toxin-like protein
MQVKVSSVLNVNSTRSGNQDEAAVAASADGGFAVAFASQAAGASEDVLARSFDFASNPLTTDFQGSAIRTSNQYQADIVVLNDGKIASVFTDDSRPAGVLETDVVVHLSKNDGSGGTANIVLNDAIGKGASDPAIAALNGGGFAAAWLAYRDGGEGFAVAARSYDSAGKPLADDFLVAIETASTGFNPDIAALPSGGFIVTWEAFDNGTAAPNTKDIKARIFSRDGVPAGDEFTVNTTTVNSQYDSRVTVLADGRIAIVWTSQDVNEANPLRPGAGRIEVDYRARVLDGNGVPAAEDFAVTDLNVANLLPASLAEIGNGNLVIAWSNSEAGVAPQQDIRATVVDTSGGLIAAPFVIGASSDQDYAPDLARLFDGRTAIVWHRWEGTSTSPDHEVKAAILKLEPDNINPPAGLDWTGSSRSDRWNGSEFDDRARGNAGNDVLQGLSGNDVLNGGDGRDYLYGGSGNDRIYGGDENDYINAGAGDDRILGNRGQDSLFGGSGADQFILYSLTEAGDTVRDFESDDTIVLNSSMFSRIADGAIDPALFARRGSVNLAIDKNDRFIFNLKDDTLWYDADGTGRKPPLLLFDFVTDVDLRASDLLIL